MAEELEFAPFMQSSVGAAIESDVPNGPAILRPRLSLAGPGRQMDLTAPGGSLRMLGPEGVVGIDARHVLRVDPPPGIQDTEPNYMPCIEFDVPELPWLFTPARPAGDRLRPWLVLTAIETDGHPLQSGLPLPFVDVDAALLPPLEQSWQWAHVQRPAGRSGPLTSRLLCPLHLKADTAYTACVVPAFAAGVTAGLQGGPTDVEQHGDAWRRDQGTVRLPVYHSWRFRTGDPGDFEQLATAVVPLSDGERAVLAGRTVDITEPWPDGAPLASDGPPGARQTITVQGVLSLVDSPPEQAGTALADFARRVREHIAQGTGDTVAPPLYGGHPVVRDRIEDGERGWLAELNLDPETRIAASLGTGWVRDNQEWLMARAWDQVGVVREANRVRRLAAFCAEVSASVHRRSVQNLSPAESLGMAAPVSERLRTESGLPLRTEVAVSPAPEALVTPALQRLLRRRGPVARRAALDTESYVRRTLTGDLLPPLPAALVTRPEPSAPPAEAATPDLTFTVDSALYATATRRDTRRIKVLSAMALSARTNDLGAQADTLGSMLTGPTLAVQPDGDLGADEIKRFRALSGPIGPQIADQLAASFAEHSADQTLNVPEQDVALPAQPSMSDDPAAHILEFGVPVDADALQGRLARALDPGPLLTARLDSTVAQEPQSPLAMPPTISDPVMACPDFAAPMAMALKDTAPEWFLPGSADIPDDRAVLLRANAPFIASFMVGVNDEMNHEMRWREYPTDLRGSPFTHFWPRPDGEPDIPPVHGWLPELGLAAQLTGNAGGVDVLLVRGRLVHRYPNMIVAAVPAQSVTESGDLAENTWERPKMVLTLDERTCAYAFDLPGDIHDWWFVLAENSYRMRFGFDTTAQEYQHWSDLTWPVGEGGFADLGAMPALPDLERDHPPPAWNAATIAMVSLQRPFRVVTSARNLIGAPR
ncbi:hypothetical protein ACFV29_40490 [Streptomyces sp. NPDC059690]|uniref:hypothetical protein n=1 Tax=Streptomyces sp. NPDC059690 TaxID=3346907 RepID=UPI0036B4AF3D